MIMSGKLSPKERELLDRCVRLNNRAEAAEGALASSQAEIERLRTKLTNCVHALTFAINGWDEGDPFIQKLRATRDGAQAALSGSKE